MMSLVLFSPALPN